jgi:glycosyltransferase involved in cell wall biosynthesis
MTKSTATDFLTVQPVSTDGATATNAPKRSRGKRGPDRAAFSPMRATAPTVVLVSQNVSRVMGGEAVKALHIWSSLAERGIKVVQVTHERVAHELRDPSTPAGDVVYVKDSAFQIWLYNNGLYQFAAFYNAWLLNRAAQKAARAHGAWLVHYTSPISPTLPYFRLTGCPTVIGPLNGNIGYPPALRAREHNGNRWQRWALPVVQQCSALMFSGKRRAARILVAGGERTIRALRHGFIRPEKMIETLDSGVSDELLARPRIAHHGRSNRFVFIGRLVSYKGCDLAIRAVAKVPDAQLDVIGDGEERETLEALCAELGVSDRVHFVGLIPYGRAVFDALSAYRGFLFPTLAEANGIVVQEAMMLGLPLVVLNWGGPALLLDAETGILVEPGSEEEIVDAFAKATKRLMEDDALAERLSRKARARAEEDGYSWSMLIDKWLKVYDQIMDEHGLPSFTARAEIESKPKFG